MFEFLFVHAGVSSLPVRALLKFPVAVVLDHHRALESPNVARPAYAHLSLSIVHVLGCCL